MPTYKMEDLLDEIQEDEVVDILLDTNELGGLLHALAANYKDDCGADAWTFYKALQDKANSIREDLVRKKYPLSNNPND